MEQKSASELAARGTPTAAVITRIALENPISAAFDGWHAAFTHEISAAPGFVSVEFSTTEAGSGSWQIVQRFRSGGECAAWQGSPERTGLFLDLSPLLRQAVKPLDEEARDLAATSFVTEVVTTAVAPGREAEFRAWAQEMQARQAAFPGYMGTLVQAPPSPELPRWTSLVRFSTPAQLDAWLTSNERKELLDRADPGVSTWSSRRMDDPFGGWFADRADAGTPSSPPAWKQTALVLLVLFPVVMLEIRYLSPLLAGVSGPLATFIGNAISVSLVSWPLMGFAIGGLKWWLYPAPARRARVELLGALTLIGLYAIEIGFFTFLW